MRQVTALKTDKVEVLLPMHLLLCTLMLMKLAKHSTQYHAQTSGKRLSMTRSVRKSVVNNEVCLKKWYVLIKNNEALNHTVP